MIENIKEWLNSPVPEEELESKDSAPGIVYQPIWVIEKLLNELSDKNWDRVDHKYSFHTDNAGTQWLATSHLLKVNVGGVERTLLCSSFINPLEYGETSNLLQTGIAEATKAGVKVLGTRFGFALNNRTVLKEKKTKIKSKVVPDAKILASYHKAVAEKDEGTIAKLIGIYDIKQEGADA